MDVRDLGEFGLIDQLSELLTRREGVAVGIGDDASVLETLRHPVVTTDALVENVHFRRDWIARFSSPQAFGRKVMEVNVSDIAAMGARPVAAFVSLALPKGEDANWIYGMYEGFESSTARTGFTVAGGDTVSAPLQMLSVTLIGDLMPEAAGQPICRSGAQVGDLVCVSGKLGDSAGGLALLLDESLHADEAARAALLHRHFDPVGRVETMRTLLKTNRAAIHAAMDVSDGLRGDVAHIARRSNVAIHLHTEKLPISEPAREVASQNRLDAIEWALSGGEDYELLLTLAPDALDELNHSLKEAMLESLTVVGEVVSGAPEVVVWQNGTSRQGQGAFTHF